MITNVIRSVLRPVINSVLSGGGIGPQPVTKVYVDPLINSLDQHYDLGPGVTLNDVNGAGDWSVRGKLNRKAASTEFMFRTGFGANNVRSTSGGQISFRWDGSASTTNLTSSNTIGILEEYEYEVGVTGTTMRIILNGITTTGPVPTNPDQLNIIVYGAKDASSDSFDGILSELDINAMGVDYSFLLNNTVEVSNGQTITPTNIPAAQSTLYTFDSIANEWNGAEILTDPDFETPGDWLFNTPPWTMTGGQAICDGTQAGAKDLYQENKQYDGRRYRMNVDVATLTAATLKLKLGGAAFGDIVAAGDYEFFEFAEGGARTGLASDSNLDCVVDSLTIKPFIKVS